MSRKQPKQKNKKSKNNIGRKFVLFVKVVDEDGFVDEDKCGWLHIGKKITLEIPSYKDAFVFTEKEEGHGFYSDWKKLLEEEHPRWRINPPTYID